MARTTAGTTTDVWEHVREERDDLLALLETLGAHDWDAASLCDGWRVRDVVGHLISGTETKLLPSLPGIAASGFKIHRYLYKDGVRRGSAATGDLVSRFRDSIPRQSCPPGQTALSMLEDIVLHQIDIRAPLNRPRTFPLDRLALVATDLHTRRFYAGKRLMDGLRFDATDISWSAGTGPTVSGPIEAIALTLSGRLLALDQLRGDGVAILQQRVAR